MNEEAQLRIERVIGNNVLLVKDESTGKEFVLFGKGMGFGSQVGGTVPAGDPRIEKRFRVDDDQMQDYRSLLEGISPEVIKISEEILQMVSEHFGQKINYKVYFALPSHIQFAIYRLRNGMEINNPFLYETKMFFSEEYEIACRASERIRQAFGIEIPDDEVGFLSYHIHSGITDVSVNEIIKFTTFIQQLVGVIEKRENIHIPRESTEYARLVAHFRYMIERILQDKKAGNPFLLEIKKMYKREYALAVNLSEAMKSHLRKEIPEEELGYIVMHLYRLLQSVDPL